MIKKWHWAFAIVGILVVLFLMIQGTGENTVSNLYIIPAGIFSPFHETNISMDQKMTGNATLAGDNLLQEQKKIDSHFSVEEWNLSSKQSSPLKITVIHVTDDELKEFSEFERSIHGADKNPAIGDTGKRSVASFEGNQSDYIRFIDAVCKNKTRAECYPNMPVFEYHGRYYFILWFVYDSTRPIG